MLMWLLILAGLILMGLSLAIINRARRITILPVENLTAWKEKNIKQALVRGRGQRFWSETYRNSRSNIFLFWGYCKRLVRPIYYWALRQVDVPVNLVQQKIPENIGPTEADLVASENALIDQINLDPKNILAYLALTSLYQPQGKLDEATEILAHVDKLVRYYPNLPEKYFGSEKMFQTEFKRLESETRLSQK